MTWHLLAHALFKSMLFMVVGILLHAVGAQDSRAIPALTASGLLIAVVALCMYQSCGWVHSPSWSTKKVAVDTMQSMGPSSVVATVGVMVSTMGSVAYTTVLLVHLAGSKTCGSSPMSYIGEIHWVFGMTAYCMLLAVTIDPTSGLVGELRQHGCYTPTAMTSSYVG